MYGMIQHKISKVDNCLQYLFSQQQLHSLPVVSVCVCVCVCSRHATLYGVWHIVLPEYNTLQLPHIPGSSPWPPRGSQTEAPILLALYTAAQLVHLPASSIGSRNENGLCSCSWWSLGFNFHRFLNLQTMSPGSIPFVQSWIMCVCRFIFCDS